MLVVGAIERAEAGKRGFGRARLSIIPNAKTPALREFITTAIADGTTVITDGLSSYPAALTEDGYEHERYPVKGSGNRADELLPGVHRLFSLTKRWLEGTHHGRVEADHLQAYLDEFTFRFNRRTARPPARAAVPAVTRAHCVAHAPVRYADLIANERSLDSDRQRRPPGRRGHPASLAGQPLDRPWRAAQ